MKARHWLQILVGLLAATFTTLATAQQARVNVIYVNGIKNTTADAESTRLAIVDVLARSENHQFPNRRNFRVEAVFNPTGWYGNPNIFNSELNQDLKELFLLKTSEEKYADSMSQILLPHNQSRLINIEAATNVRRYLFDMTPGVTSLEAGANPEMTDAEMAETQTAIFKLVAKVRALGSAVVVAHSQGNLLANLAWATLAVEHGNNIGSVMRLVNVANTSKVSVNGLDFTHGGDAALFSGATSSLAPLGDKSLETLPSQKGWTRSTSTTLRLGSSTSNFELAAAPFNAYTGNINYPNNFAGVADVTLKHSIVLTYLNSEQGVTVAPNPSNPPSAFFTPERDKLVDRFEDFVYAAAAALGAPVVSTAPTITPGGQPQAVIASVGSTVNFAVIATGSAPLTYQWQRNGTPVPCTSSVNCSNLSWNVGAADGGAQFRVIVSNSAGSVTSNSASLNVLVTPPPLPGLVAPTPLSPSGTIVSLTPVLSWSGGAGAANYEINVRDTTTNTIVLRQQGVNTASTSFTMPAGLLVNGRQYRWDISACPNFACSSGFVTSGNLTFFTQVITPPIAVPDLIAQAVVFEPSTVTVGGMTLVTFSIVNTGAATSSSSQAAIRITSAAATDPGSINVGSVAIPGISAGGSVMRTIGVNVPTAGGNYKVWVVADSNGAAGQSTAARANDAAAAPLTLTVVPRVIPFGGTAEGAYGGTMTGGPNPNFRMLVLEDGEFWSLYGVNVGGQLLVSGFIQGRAASGGGSLSASDVRDFGFFPAVGGGTISGTFDVAVGTLQAVVRFPGLTVNVIGGSVRDVPYEYNKRAELTELVGTWALVANTGDRITLNVAATGAMTATSAAGCLFTGTVVPRPSGKNVFNATLQFGAAPCVLPGQLMTGVAVVNRLQNGSTQLTFAGVNGARTAGLMATGTR